MTIRHESPAGRGNCELGPLPRFPIDAELIWEEAQEFRRLGPTERFLAIVDLIDFGEAMLAASPHGAFAAEQRLLQEEEWQRTQKELFARHGR